MITQSRGRAIYHLNVAYLKVPERSLHFNESEAQIISICVLVEETCSYGPLRPSNLANKSNSKFSNTDAPISHLREVGV